MKKRHVGFSTPIDLSKMSKKYHLWYDHDNLSLNLSFIFISINIPFTT